jgi:hypothetical protein
VERRESATPTGIHQRKLAEFWSPNETRVLVDFV